MSANRNSTGERSHRALIPHANFRKRARPHTTLPPLPSSSSFSLSFVSSSSSSGDSPLYCFSNKSLSGSYALRLSPPPLPYRQVGRRANFKFTPRSPSLLPPPSPIPAKTRKLKARLFRVLPIFLRLYRPLAITALPNLVPFDRSSAPSSIST